MFALLDLSSLVRSPRFWSLILVVSPLLIGCLKSLVSIPSKDATESSNTQCVCVCVLDIPINFPEGPLQLDKYLSLGQQPGEELLPEDSNESSSSAEPSFNQNDIDQLKAMGFSENRRKRALLNTGHNGADIAMNWMFEHMEDPDIDDPLPAASANTASSATASGPSEDQIATLQEMGFSAQQAKKALHQTVR